MDDDRILKVLTDNAAAQQKLASDVMQTTTVLRQNLGEQRRLNDRYEKLIGTLIERQNETDTKLAVIENRVPTELISGDQLNRRFQRVDAAIATLARVVESIKTKIAWWSGGLAAVVALTNLLPSILRVINR